MSRADQAGRRIRRISEVGRYKLPVAVQHIRGVPELVVEVASQSRRKRDRTIKRALDERADVSEYWTVDPYSQVIRVYRNGSERFGQPVEVWRDAGTR